MTTDNTELKRLAQVAAEAQRDLDRAELEETIPQSHLDRADAAYEQQQVAKHPGPNYPDR